MAYFENKPMAPANGMLCYLFGIFYPILYLSSEPYKHNAFLRFHSVQSIIFTLSWAALTLVINYVRFPIRAVNALLAVLWLLFFVTWIVLMFRASRGKKTKLPVAGNIAERWAE